MGLFHAMFQPKIFRKAPTHKTSSNQVSRARNTGTCSQSGPPNLVFQCLKKKSWAGGVIFHPLMYQWGGAKNGWGTRISTLVQFSSPGSFNKRLKTSGDAESSLTWVTNWTLGTLLGTLFSALSNCAIGPRHGISKDEGSSARTSVPGCSVRPLMTLSCRRERVNMVSPAIRAWQSKLRLKPGSKKGSGKNYCQCGPFKLKVPNWTKKNPPSHCVIQVHFSIYDMDISNTTYTPLI